MLHADKDQSFPVMQEDAKRRQLEEKLRQEALQAAGTPKGGDVAE